MKKNLLTRTLLLSLIACTCLVECWSQPTRRAHAGTTPPTTGSRPAVEIKFRDMRFGKPPLVELYFDVTLRNRRDEPRWFLLPSHLYPQSTSFVAKGGVDHLDVFAPRGEGRVLLGHFLGTGGFQTLLLAARAEVRLRRLHISFWGELPARLRVEVVTAKRLQIGGEDAESWFGMNPTSSAVADSAEDATNQMHSLRSKSTPDGREVSARFEEDRRFELEVSLGKEKKVSLRTAKPTDQSVKPTKRAGAFVPGIFVNTSRSAHLF